MAKFGKLSEKRLKTCEAKLQILFREVVQSYDCSIHEGHRGKALQNKYKKQGKSRLVWPNGPHNEIPSKAVHAIPHPFPGWKNIKAFYFFAGYVIRTAEEMRIQIRWGGDWDRDKDLDDQSFMDLIHFELVDE